MTAWLDIVGFAEGDPLPELPSAHTVIGPQRVVDRLSQRKKATGEAGVEGSHNLVPWRSLKLDAMIAQTLEHRGKPTVLLASGDPLWFGFGATLSRHLQSDEFRITPAASSFQFAAARIHSTAIDPQPAPTSQSSAPG